MQFNVPQFIDIEDKVIGPLTLKQFMYLAIGGAILFAFWFFFEIWAFVLVAIPIAALACAFAFVKIHGRPFLFFLGAAIQYFSKPKLYIWRKNE